jgi:glucokinase
MDKPRDSVAPVIAGADVEAVARALLQIGPDDVERVRTATPSRRRPQRLHGPTADYGRADDPLD